MGTILKMELLIWITVAWVGYLAYINLMMLHKNNFIAHKMGWVQWLTSSSDTWTLRLFDV
jgi:hypothetical protein